MINNVDPAQDLDYNDIYACDKCGGPTFHDAPAWASLQNAYIGEMKVLCNRCASTHELVIQPKGSPYPAPIEESWYRPSKWESEPNAPPIPQKWDHGGHPPSRRNRRDLPEGAEYCAASPTGSPPTSRLERPAWADEYLTGPWD